MQLQQGCLEVLQWARSNGYPWNELICAEAAAGGYEIEAKQTKYAIFLDAIMHALLLGFGLVGLTFTLVFRMTTSTLDSSTTTFIRPKIQQGIGSRSDRDHPSSYEP